MTQAPEKVDRVLLVRVGRFCIAFGFVRKRPMPPCAPVLVAVNGIRLQVPARLPL